MYPNFIIAGAPKCGTTSVYHWLSKHPEVCASTRKEVQFFMDRDSSVFRPEDNYHDHGIEGYQKFFHKYDKNQHKVVFEATPGYIYQDTAIKNLGKELPNTRFIFILREPSSRLYSIYRYFTQNKNELDKNISFKEFIQKIDDKSDLLKDNEFLRNGFQNGIYVDYLDRWSKVCGKENIIVLPYEEIAKDDVAFTKNLCSIMEIDPTFYDTFEFQSQNQTVQVKNHLMHKLAISLSALVPFGPLRDSMRNLYYKFNGNLKKKNTDDEVTLTLQSLKQRYHAHNIKLSEKYKLNIDDWK